jgi:DNA gyrase inhibitor GyrI
MAIMNDNIAASLSVSIKELPPIHVACIAFKAPMDQSEMHDRIGECFRLVQAWLRGLGYDPLTLTIGVINMVEGQLASYDCCVQAPKDVESGSDGVEIRDLVGGQYAVLSMQKDPAIIGNSIGQFYQEYLPQNQIILDGARPTYEIYYESTMEYCVPIMSSL